MDGKCILTLSSFVYMANIVLSFCFVFFSDTLIFCNIAHFIHIYVKKTQYIQRTLIKLTSQKHRAEYKQHMLRISKDKIQNGLYSDKLLGEA